MYNYFSMFKIYLLIFSFFFLILSSNTYWLQSYVAEHNNIRSEVIDINKYWLSWSQSLEKDAQNWANYLARNYWRNQSWSNPHAKNFNKWKHSLSSVGQWENIAWGSPSMSISTAINLWAAEKKDYNYENNSCSWVCGHYTQIVWQNTTKIWCASAKSTIWYWEWVVCRYSPAWNYIWQSPYEKRELVSIVDEELNSANNLAKKWIIKNNSSNPSLYNLNNFVLRQEIWLISRRVSGVAENSSCKNIFSDVNAYSPNNWVCKNIEALVENDLISRNESFRPEDNISKSEALIMFIKSIGFVDFEIDENSDKNWQEQVVEFAVKNWVVDNFTDYNAEAKRGWIFKIADFSIKIKEDRIKKGTWFKKESKKYSSEI